MSFEPTLNLDNSFHTIVLLRDTRGLVRLTVDPKVNGDSRSTNERDPSFGGSLGLSCQYKRISFCLGCPSWPSTKYFLLHRTLFEFFCPHRPASWAGSRAGSPVSQYVSPVLIVNCIVLYIWVCTTLESIRLCHMPQSMLYQSKGL